MFLDISPEIVKREQYSEKVDIWCIGIMMYEMAFGQPPFHGKNSKATSKLIKSVNLGELEAF